jgi:hypothetical protein
MMLIIASFYNVYTETKESPEVACKNEMVFKIMADSSSNSSGFKLETANNDTFYPVFESDSLILVENSKVRICYSEIDSSNASHKTISINKVVFLP